VCAGGTREGSTKFKHGTKLGRPIARRAPGYRCSVCPRNSKQLFHNQAVLMTSHYFNFDAVTHSVKDLSVSTRQSLASSELFRMYG